MTDTNAREVLEKKKKVKWRWCRKLWSAIALSAKSGHRRPLYFNLCSLNQAEEQQLLQQEQRMHGCQQSRQQGSPYTCYPVERRKIAGEGFPSRDPLPQKQILADKSKSCPFQWASAVMLCRSEKTEGEGQGEKIYICTHTHPNILTYTCSHWILLMLGGTSFSSSNTFVITPSLKH